MAPTSRRYFPISLPLLAALASCATLPPSAQQYDNFADYAESVFRHQNDLISRLMMLNETEQLEENAEVEQAEQEMQEACQLLNEYAERESDGDFIGPFFKRKVQTSIENCDRNIQQLETLLAGRKKHP